MGILSEVFGGLGQIGGEMTRQVFGGKTKKKRHGGGGGGNVIFKSYHTTHYHVYRKRKKNPFQTLLKEIRKKD